MSETSGAPQWGGDSEATAEEIERHLRAKFEDADLHIEQYTDYLDVRVVPHDVAAEIEDVFQGANATPYSAFRMTIQLD